MVFDPVFVREPIAAASVLLHLKLSALGKVDATVREVEDVQRIPTGTSKFQGLMKYWTKAGPHHTRRIYLAIPACHNRQARR